MRQIALPLDELRPDTESFLIISPANADIIAAIENAGNWPGHCAILAGPPRSGKGMIARYFEGLTAGEVIDHADKVAEDALFYAWNRAQENKRPLMLVSEYMPGEWDVALADLRSRLGSALLLQMPPPDDEMVEQLVQKHLHDRGAGIGVDALSYVVKRIGRDYAVIEQFARDANRLALSENSAINLPLVRKMGLD